MTPKHNGPAGPADRLGPVDPMGSVGSVPAEIRDWLAGINQGPSDLRSVRVPVALLLRTSTDDLQDPVGSILRQYRVSTAALPPQCEVVAVFYDVESGRKDLDRRGRGDPAALGLRIPVHRDGGIQDLLAAAEGPNPGFRAVCCEQIDRIARSTYYGTQIEHRLEAAGIALWAADEKITVPTGRTAVIDPAAILTRRVKQGVAEWYALDILRRSRDGYETHTEQGYQIGRAPYGHRGHTSTLRAVDALNPADTATPAAENSAVEYDAAADASPEDGPTGDPAAVHRDPVGAAPAFESFGLGDPGTGAGKGSGEPSLAWEGDGRRGRGQRGKGKGLRTKTTLYPHPAEAATVQRIFLWRVVETLGYQAIADRLNQDLTLNPPPTPVREGDAVGEWTVSNVRDVLAQPKHTGYMVWNRRATKTRNGAYNPPSEWIWSSRRTHEPIIDLRTWVDAQRVAVTRERSRSGAGPNRAHPQTKRSYRLRSRLVHELCGRRMFGKTRDGRSYYACAPKPGQPVPDGHPGSVWVAESLLLDGLTRFCNDHVFGAYRERLLQDSADELHATQVHEHAERLRAAEAALRDNENRQTRLVHSLELAEDLDREFVASIARRRGELAAERATLQTALAKLRAVTADQPEPALLDHLPIGTCDIAALPEDLAHRLFAALNLTIAYDKTSHTARYTVTLAAGPALVSAVSAARDSLLGSSSSGPTGPDDEGLPSHGTTRTSSSSHGTEVPNGTTSFPSVACPRRGACSIGDAFVGRCAGGFGGCGATGTNS